MSRSAHRFLSKKKQVAGMAVGAIAMLAMAGPALTDDDSEGKKDEVFKVTTTINAGANPLVSFDISWFDPALKKYFLADRSNNQIDVVVRGTNTNMPLTKVKFA